jgi:hypothetical protein
MSAVHCERGFWHSLIYSIFERFTRARASENMEHQNLSVQLMTEIAMRHCKAPKLQKVLEMSVSVPMRKMTATLGL